MLSDWKLQTTFNEDGGVTHGHVKWKATCAIGTGAYGSVWLQESIDGEPKCLRAVKTVQKRASQASKNRSNLAEVEILTKVLHRDDLFVKFLGWYEDRAMIYIAMEFIENGDLSYYIESYPPAVREHAKEITKQLLGGLEVLHSLKICHRDLKPKNILIASCDPLHVKIADFGIAKIEMDTVLRTHIGTHGYFAPEIMPFIRDKIKGFTPSHRYTDAVDLWAVGVILHEILTSEIPFVIRSSCDETYSGVGENVMGGNELDFPLLEDFCAGRKGLPLDLLEGRGIGYKVGENSEMLRLLKCLLAANPEDRISATKALENPWIQSLRSSNDTGGITRPDPLPPRRKDLALAPVIGTEVRGRYYKRLTGLSRSWQGLYVDVMISMSVFVAVFGLIRLIHDFDGFVQTLYDYEVRRSRYIGFTPPSYE